MSETAATMTLDAEQLVREFLRAHPSVSRRQLVDGVEAERREVLAAFEALVERGEAEYVAPERPGQPGQCVLLDGGQGSPEDAEDAEAELWKSAARCPTCGRPPNVRFSRREVERARRERQLARLQTARCTRCGTRYWIRARDVANATLDASAAAA